MPDFRDAISYATGAAYQTGLFDAVAGHEPKAAPSRTGLTAAAWIQDWRPATSGLASTSMRLEVTLRVFCPMQMEPQDDIDMAVMTAVNAIFSYIIGHFQGLAGSRYVDVHGADGEMLSASLGYAEQDKAKFRIADITIPVVLNDVYSEVA
jgi:hypothetical protein